MPVVKFKVKRILDELDMSLDELREYLFRLKCETEVDDEGYIYVELNPDRPDMFSLEGILRSLKGLMGIERGYKIPETRLSDIIIMSKEVISRPVIMGAVVKGLRFDNDDIEELMQFQEKLHETLGRRRKKVAIGIHDYDKLPDKNIIYKEVDINTTRMIPLYGSHKITIKEVLDKTEQGKKYGDLSLRNNSHPALIAGGEIISLPPVINSEITRVDTNTRNLFIDVTGTDPYYVSGVLDIIACNLFYKGGEIEKVMVKTKDKDIITPLFSERTLEVKVEDFTNILGIDFTVEDLKDLLERARYNVIAVNDSKIKVKAPPNRLDVFGVVDLAEDIAIVIGYENLPLKRNLVPLSGSISRLVSIKRKIRDILVGLGFTEIIQLTLTNPSLVNALELNELALKVRNPVQIEYSIVRPNLIAGMLSFLKDNQHKEKPIKIFEMGRVAWRKNKYIIEEEHLALAIMDTSTSYEDIQAPLYTLLKLLNINFELKPAGISYLLKGRSALILLNGDELGWLGEINPEVLEKIGVEYPIVAAEISLSLIAGKESYRIQGL